MTISFRMKDYNVMNKTKTIALAMIFTFTFLLCSTSYAGSSGSLLASWEANNDDTIGYKLYYRAEGSTEEQVIDVGNVTEYEITGLTIGVLYLVRITAYGQNDESNKSQAVGEVAGRARVKGFKVGGE